MKDPGYTSNPNPSSAANLCGMDATTRLYDHKKHILELPDELLICIVHRISGLPQQHQQDLKQVSLVCQRLGSLVTEELLLSPMVHIHNIHAPLRAYFRYPACIVRVRSLELLTHDCPETEWADTAVKPASTLHGDEGFKHACAEIIAKSGLSTRRKRQCTRAMRTYSHDAFLAVLLLMLTNQVELHCGTTRLSILSMVHSLLTREEYPRQKTYLQDALTMIAQRLKTLELPYSWSGFYEHNSFRSTQNMLMFGSLKHLSLPADALPLRIIDVMRNQRFSITSREKQGPYHMLPSSLETLEVLFYNRREAPGIARYFAYSKSAYPALRTINFVHNLDTGGQVKWKDDEELVQVGKEKDIDICIHYRPTSRFRKVISELAGDSDNADIAALKILSDEQLLAYDMRGCYSELIHVRRKVDAEMAQDYQEFRRAAEARKRRGRRLDIDLRVGKN